MVLPISPVLEDFADFLAKLAPRKILEYKSSSRSQKRLNFLLKKNKSEALTAEEQDEMAYFMMIEHLVRLAKARALQRVNLEEN